MKFIQTEQTITTIFNNLETTLRYEAHFPHVTLFIDKELISPMTQIVSLEKYFRDVDYESIQIKISKQLRETFQFLLDSTYLLTNANYQKAQFEKN